MTKYSIIFVILCLHSTLALYGEENVVTITSKSPPYLTRVIKHIYYVGSIDNGTLDCEMPGAVSYRWLSVSKEEISEGGYVYSWEDEMKLTNADKPWLMEISNKNYQTNSALIQCLGMNGYDGDAIAEKIWVVTRLHSPLGYPTDPIICGGKLRKCEELKWLFRIECMPDYGPQYRGTVAKTKSGEECQTWSTFYLDIAKLGEKPTNPSWKGDPRNRNYYLSRGQHAGLIANKESDELKGEHNYCRAFVYDYSHVNQVRPPECLKYTASRDFMKRIAEPIKEYEQCDVPKCSPCMYGDGRGNLPPYKHKLPIYNGTIRETFRKYKGPGGKTMFKQCYMSHSNGEQYWTWYRLNRCHYKLTYSWKKKHEAKRPSCFIFKGTGAFETPNIHFTHTNLKRHMTLERCRIRQCTIRIVWFLFFDEDGEIVIDTQSSQVPRKFVFIEGKKAVIKFYVFGMHLTSGMKILPMDKKRKAIVKEWKLKVHRIPKLSELHLGTKAKPEYTGEYFFMYHFEEADPTIELGTYSQLLDIEVRKPLTISLSPLSVHICEREEGVIRLTIHGDFEVLTQNIEWSYSFTKHETPTVVTLKTTFIRISENGRAVHVSQAAFIFVNVKWKHGTVKSQARVFVTGKPLLQNVSPLLTIAYPGDTIKLALATDSPHNKLTWIHDAQKIEEIPDQLNMAFSERRTSKDIIYVLTIDNILKEQFGVYTIKAVNTKNCKHSIEFTLQAPVEDTVYTKIAEEEEAPIRLSNKSLATFKAVMDFMQSDCADIIGAPKMSDIDQPAMKQRKLLNKPVNIYKLLSTTAPYCISLRHPQPYFEMNLVNLTRIKGLRISQVPSQGNDDGDDDGMKLRLMYSNDACKWKIFGAKPRIKRPQNGTSETNIKTEPRETLHQNLVTKIEARYESTVFPTNNSLNWIGNTSLIFARHIRLVPANTSMSRKDSCIRVHIYGCPATILEIPKKIWQTRRSSSVGVVLGVLGGLVGTVVLIIGSWCVFKKRNLNTKDITKIWKIIRTKLKIKNIYDIYEDSYYEYYYESSGSEDMTEHVYYEIPELKTLTVPQNITTSSSAVEK